MAPPPIIEERTQNSHRAKVRIGVAAALLVTAIGILAVLNKHKTEEAVEEPEAERTVEQASMSSADMETPTAAQEAAAPTIAPPTQAEAVALMPPPPPEPGKLPETMNAPKTAAASAGPVLEEESAGASASAPYIPSAAKTLGKTEMSAAAVHSPAQTSAKTPATLAPLAPAPKAFEVQLGVFTDIDNAKQLQTKLTQHGIPSHTETRVQIGPFKSRAEADRAKEKLKALGLSSVVLGK